MSGYYEVCGKMSANHFVSGLRGPNELTFPDGQHIRFGFPNYKLGGNVMGERTIEVIGSTYFEDLTNNRKAVLIFNSFKKTGWIRSTTSGCKDSLTGIIYDSSKPIDSSHSAIRKKYCKEIEYVSDFKSLKDVKKKLATVEGSYLNSLYIDGQKYWDIEEDIPFRQIPMIDQEETVVCPSDWRYREDLLWLRYNYKTIAQQWKIKLEVQQRHDRALRQKFNKKLGKSK